MIDTATLTGMKCQPRQTALTDVQVQEYLAAVPGWTLQQGKIGKTFGFQDYYQTLAFVNAIAYVIHAEDHHPELTVGYNRCAVSFDTHSVNDGRGGLSENDFICAAKLDAIYQQSFTRPTA